MALTQRDKTLLFQLSNFALMTTKQIRRSVFGDIAMTTVLRRLRALENEGYIQRIEGLANAERAWTVTQRGCEEFVDRIPKRHFNRATLPHDVKLTELRMALEGHGIAHSWIPEHEIRSEMARSYGISRMQGRNVPDGLMGIERSGVKHSIGIELELHFKNWTRYRSIFYNYRAKKSLWGIWYLVQTQSLGRHLDKVWRRLYGETEAPLFMWSLVDEVIANPLAAPIYCYGNTSQAGRLWTPKTITQPAHQAAQGVSSKRNESAENESAVNTRIGKELSAKVV